MAVKLVTPDPIDAPGGVSQYWTRMVRAAAGCGQAIEWVPQAQWDAEGGDPAKDLLIIVNQDVRKIPQPYAVIGVAHGTAMERFLRTGERMWFDMGREQWESAQRPRTFWVVTCVQTAFDAIRHMGIHADRVIAVGCDADLLFPSERQTRRVVGRPVILHRAVDLNKGGNIIGRIAEELGGGFELRELSAPVERLGDAFRDADMFLLPSREEGGPNVLAEAMTAGLVVVTSNVGLAWPGATLPAEAVQSRHRGAVAWADRQMGIVVFDWLYVNSPELIADFVRGAWSARASLDPRPFALQHFGMGVFGQKWRDAIEVAAAKLEVPL